jgi:hypothetical protein
MEENFMFLELLVRCGEYEFYCKSVHTVPKDKSMEGVANDWASTFYYNDELVTPDNGWYYFNGDEIGVKVYHFKKVTEEEFNVLIKFI